MGFGTGQVVGDYEILSVLGKGGMGRVYRVRNLISNRVEAMKALLADAAAEADLGGRFLAEIRILARLDHPNIAKFYTAFKHEKQLLLLMEYVEGFTLSDRLKQGAVPLGEAVGYMRQALSALSYAHANGIIHRDIKPANLMVTPQGVVKLMDFGIAKCESDPVLTRPGTTVGSLLYMSPEQVRGEAVDARSDLYSLGIVLYELTAGGRPFEADSTFGILNAHLNVAPRPAVEVNAAIPAAANDLIMTALAKDPAQRFQSADAFRRALDSLGVASSAAGIPTVITGPQQLQTEKTQGEKSRDHRGLWMAAGAIACVCVLAAAAIVVPRLQTSSANSHPSPAQAVSPAEKRATPPPRAVAGDSGAVPAPAAIPVQLPPPRHRLRPPRAVSPMKGVPAKIVDSSNAADSNAPNSQPQPRAVPAGPSAQEIETVRDGLMQIHARADAVSGSLNRLSAQQAAEGLGLRQDIAASASRLAAYVQAADQAAGTNDLNSARKNMARAEQELSKLEAFLGR
jgi:serine/threonine protein kinase